MVISGNIILYSQIKCSIRCPFTRNPNWCHLWIVIKIIFVL